MVIAGICHLLEQAETLLQDDADTQSDAAAARALCGEEVQVPVLFPVPSPAREKDAGRCCPYISKSTVHAVH